MDGGPATTVNKYNATLLEQQAIYTSPTLPDGTHTIRVTKSGGTDMTIDAFRVSF